MKNVASFLKLSRSRENPVKKRLVIFILQMYKTSPVTQILVTIGWNLSLLVQMRCGHSIDLLVYSTCP